MPAAKYKFIEQNAYDHKIGNADDGTVIGTLRVKPSTILWRPKRARGVSPWFSVSLDDLTDWIVKQNNRVGK
jgi:hypothetical protein